MDKIFESLTTAEEEALILVGAFLARGQKIYAIETLRIVSSASLGEAKDYVDRIYAKLYPPRDAIQEMYADFSRNTSSPS